MKYKSFNFLLFQVIYSSSIWLIILTETKDFCKSTRKKYIVHIEREKQITPEMYVAFNSRCSRRRKKNLVFLRDHSIFLEEMCKRFYAKQQSSEESWSTVVWLKVLFYTLHDCIKTEQYCKIYLAYPFQWYSHLKRNCTTGFVPDYGWFKQHVFLIPKWLIIFPVFSKRLCSLQVYPKYQYEKSWILCHFLSSFLSYN